jgi:hypothetical protein
MQDVVVQVQITYTIPEGSGKVGKKEIEKIRTLATADTSHIVREVGSYMGRRLVDVQIDGF